MKLRLSPLVRKLLILPPLAVGVIAFAWLVSSRAGPDRKPEEEHARALRVIEVPRVDVPPRAIGYGTSQPGRIWQAVVDVKGRIVEVHPDLKPGAIIKRDTVVLRIDPSEYQLTVERLTAELDQAAAKRDELATKTKNYDAQLDLESRTLVLANAELSRLKNAMARGAVVQSAVDTQERAVLQQELQKIDVENAKNLLPTEQKSTEALIKVKEKALEQAKLDLEKTKLVAPFDCRIGPVDIEVSQYLSIGQRLFEGDGIDVAEVEASLTPRQVRSLVGARLANMGSTPFPKITMELMRDIFQMQAVVRFQIGPMRVQWPAKFARVREAIDPATQTVGMVVAIDQPYRKAVPGVRNPPLKGMFCEVEFRGVKQIDKLVIPRSAVRDGRVYVVDAQDRLEPRDVEIELRQGSFAVVANGLAAGDRVVVSDPTPAITGALVKPIVDGELRARLVEEASGEGESP